MSVRKILLASVASLFLGGGAALAYSYGFERNVLSDSFCADLGDPAVYEKKNMDHYSVMISGKEGWIFRTENDFRKNWKVNERTVDYLRTLQDAFRAHNAELVILMPPVRGLAHADMLFRKDKKVYNLKDIDSAWAQYESAIAELQRNGINIVGVNRDEVTEDFFYKRDHHWTASGAKVAANKLAGFIKVLPVYSQIQKSNFVTTEQPPIEYASTFEKAFKKICNTSLPSETVPQYITASAKPIQSSSDLFDDSQSSPQVVLLGTSNSVNDSSQANFEGFLKDYLSADVLNQSYIGAGIDTGIMDYIDSDHFKNPQPKVVIWEVPGYYDLNVMDDKLFNQAIPAAMGICQAPVRQRTVNSLPAGKTTLFDLTQNTQSLHPASYSQAASQEIDNSMYLHMGFSQPVNEKFVVEFEYEDGGTKNQNFSRSDRSPKENNFFTLIPDHNSQLKKVSVVMSNGTQSRDLEVRVCPLPDHL